MDPVLADIFVKEMRGHLGVIQQFLADGKAGRGIALGRGAALSRVPYATGKRPHGGLRARDESGYATRRATAPLLRVRRRNR